MNHDELEDLHDEIDDFRDKILQLISQLQEQELPDAGIVACALIQAAVDIAILMPNEEPLVQSLKSFVSTIVNAYIKRTVEMPRGN